MTLRFDDRVAIVTGAGGGLGRAHALALAERGARVVVNDFGGARDGTGGSSEPAEKVVAEIEAAGGTAMANGADVTDRAQVEQMAAAALDAWGRIDVLVNNAGILRDASFHKGEIADTEKVLDVHLMGTILCTRAVWPAMRAQEYGRVVVTTSSSGLYGNFGQSNYGAAKMGVLGLMNTLGIEGAKYGIRVNALCPGAATRMTEGLLPAEAASLSGPETVAPALVFLASEDAPDRAILNATAGGYSRTYLVETRGVALTPDAQSAEAIAARWDEISDRSDGDVFTAGAEQFLKFVQMAMKAREKQ